MVAARTHATTPDGRRRGPRGSSRSAVGCFARAPDSGRGLESAPSSPGPQALGAPPALPVPPTALSDEPPLPGASSSAPRSGEAEGDASSAVPSPVPPRVASGHALARVGLLGNPSDGYGGKVIAFTIRDFGAEVWVQTTREGTGASVTGPTAEAALGTSLDALFDARDADPLPPGTELLLAAWRRFRATALTRGLDVSTDGRALSLHASTTIPRQVGLSGSSALVIACLRALSAHFGLRLDPFELSELAYAAETEDLGITAGPQDRVVQAYEGLVAMDFQGERSAAAYTTLETTLVPPVVLAWTPQVGAPSGVAHGEIRRRFDAGDADVRAALAVFPSLVDEGLEALVAGDAGALARLMDANFEARRSIWPLAKSDLDLIALARAEGCGAKLAGSGGAIVALPRDGDAARRDAIVQAFEAAGYSACIPDPGPRPTRGDGARDVEP